MANIFYNIEPKVINTELACLIGLNEAIVLQQLHYWLEKNKASATNYYDGYFWTYGTIQEYRDRDFKFWSFNTVKRTITRLVEQGFLIKGNYNKMKLDQTAWYTINYAALDEWIIKNTPSPDSDSSSQSTVEQAATQDAPMQKPGCMVEQDAKRPTRPKMSQSNSSNCPIPPAQNELMEKPTLSQCNSPHCTTPSAQDEPLHQPILGHAIPENTKEINNMRLTNKTNTQRTAAPTARDKVEIIDPAELLFNEFWKLYPRKESKQQAKKAWMKLNSDQDLFNLIANALEYRSQTKEWLAEGGRYIPHPATWLNGRRWEDELDPQKLCQSAILEERYSGITIDGKPLDPVQRKQMEYIEKQMRGLANNGEM